MSYLGDEAVKLLLSPEPLDLLVYSLVLLQLLQVRPATVKVRTETKTQPAVQFTPIEASDAARGQYQTLHCRSHTYL